MDFFKDSSVVVAIIAALISSLAALYARWQVTEARKANNISLHENRFLVYKSLGRFKGQLTAHGAGFNEEEIWLLDFPNLPDTHH